MNIEDSSRRVSEPVAKGIEELGQWLQESNRDVQPDNIKTRNLKTNYELLYETHHAITDAGRSKAAEELRRRIKTLCAAAVDQQLRGLTGQEIEDLTQEVFLKLYKPGWKETMDPTPAFLNKIARNLCFDKYRALKTRHMEKGPVSLTDSDEVRNSLTVSFEELVIHKMEDCDLQAQMRSLLKPLTYQVVYRRIVDVEEYRDIANALEIQEDYARQLYARGVRQLRSKFRR